MRAWLLVGIAILGVVGAVHTGLAEVPNPLRPNVAARLDVSLLITQLSDADPGIRKAANDRLLSVCETAGPQLMRAMDSADPELRAVISNILLHRNWMIPTDPESVKALLAPYGSLDADGRWQLVNKLGDLSTNDTTNAFIQILEFDPSASVRWEAAQMLRNGNTRAFYDQLKSLSVDSNNPVISGNAPLLAACGWVWRETDVRRTNDLLSRAIALEAHHPSATHGQLTFAYLWLIQANTDNGNYPIVLGLLRDQALRTSLDDVYLPAPVANLIAFHAEHGPFPGFLTDLQTYRQYLDRPELLYAMGRIALRREMPIVSSLLNKVALGESAFSPEDHSRVASFLIEQGWNDAARQELAVALWFASGNQAANVYFQLAKIAEETGDDFSIAVNLESALKRISGEMQRTTQFGEVLPWSESDAWAEVHWHYLRAAQAAHDMSGIHTHLEKLMELDRLGQIFQKDPTLATDIVPALNDTGQTDDARKVFDTAYKNLKDVLSFDPAEPEAKNNLAWLCARCNQRLDEAVALSDQAVAAAPDNSAYLDTSAEAHFRVGQRARAVELEKKARQLKPNDAFMKEQLKRFAADPASAH